jgi:hypothetical protein
MLTESNSIGLFDGENEELEIIWNQPEESGEKMCYFTIHKQNNYIYIGTSTGSIIIISLEGD